VLVGVLLAAGASAQAAVRYPGQRATSDPWLLVMRDMATQYWDAHGVPGCVPAVDLADTLAGSDTAGAVAGRGWSLAAFGECRVAFDAGWIGQQFGRTRRPWKGWRHGLRLRLRRGPLADVCAVVVHEVGHARGLPHTETGVMAARRADMPEGCRALARRLIPRPARS
jgi:hypothetical protein